MAKAKRISAESRFPDGFRILKGKQEYVAYVEHSSVRIWASEAETHYDTHTHSAIEIIMPHSGVAVYQLPDTRYHVRAGEILIIPSGCAHSLTEPKDTFRHLLLFEPNPLLTLRDIPEITEMMRNPVYLTGETILQKQTADILLQVIDYYNRREPMWNTQCYACLLRMYALLGKDYLEKAQPVDIQKTEHSNSPIMGSAMTFISEHYMEDVTLDQVAAFTGFSRYYFSRTFRDFTGFTFLEYLTRKRLNAATDLLIRTNRSVQSISEAAGFASTATFNRVFRKYKNCTPTQFRAIYGQMVVPDAERSDTK